MESTMENLEEKTTLVDFGRIPPITETSVCKGCKKELPRGSFSWYFGTNTKRSPFCSTCKNQRSRAHQKKMWKERYEARRDAKRKAAAEYEIVATAEPSNMKVLVYQVSSEGPYKALDPVAIINDEPGKFIVLVR